MNFIKLSHIQWAITSFAKKLGIWGLVGLCSIIGAVLFYCVNIPKIQSLTDETIASKNILIANIAQNKSIVEDTPPQQNLEDISRFYKQFPTAEALPSALATINKISNQHKLALNSGDYKFSKVKEKNELGDKKLTKYEVILPIKGQYPQIRAFINQVLQQLPALALLDMQLRRENTENPTIDARLVFVIFVRSAP